MRNRIHPTEIIKRTEHRPWPQPPKAWWWRQSWEDLLFLHYSVPYDFARSLVPEPLKVQKFEGKTWLGIVPFKMSGVMLRPFPDMPGISEFPECNVRLYVEHEGKPGVWFLSLDATNRLAVWGGKRIFQLPYKKADIRVLEHGEWIDYHSVRNEGDDHAELKVRYLPVSKVFQAKPGTLEYFLTERYCLYAGISGELYRADVHHHPWPLQTAEARIERISLVKGLGDDLFAQEPLAHYSAGVDVVAWNLEKL